MSERRKRVLVADDDLTLRTMIARALHANYDVILAEDGHSALAELSKDPPPDLAILDVMMPGLDGFAVARQLRAVPGRHVPILFLTARDTPKDHIEGIQVGARHYVTKPFVLKDLMDKIAKITR
ncbi:MAG: response regulator [Polyangiaceae bacterium]